VQYHYAPFPGTDPRLIEAQKANIEKALKETVTIASQSGVVVIVEAKTFKETRRKFTVPAATRVPWALNLPDFVTTKGGEYFFLPSKTALKTLASKNAGRTNGGRQSFLDEYDALERMETDPRIRAEKQWGLIVNWFFYGPKDMFEELRRARPVLTMPGYPPSTAPGSSPPLVPGITIFTKYDAVKEVLDGKLHPELSVRIYTGKMSIAPPRPPRGPFILGMEVGDPKYAQELAIVGKAVQNSPPLTDKTNIETAVGKMVDAIIAPFRSTGQLDAIQNLSWPLLIDFNAWFFGVPGDREKWKQWLRDLFVDIFLNPTRDMEKIARADAAAREMNAHLDGLIQQTIPQFPKGSTKDPCSVLEALVKEVNQNPSKFDPAFVRRNLMGLLVASVETNLKAIARVIDQLIRRRGKLAGAQVAAKDGRRDVVLQYGLEAMRFNPQNHVLFRYCEKETVVAGTPIPKDSVVYAATLPAMFDAEVFPNPENFDHTRFAPGREGSKHLFFGHDGHECLGRYLSPILLQEVLMRVLKLDELDRASDDTFDPFDVVPTEFKLTSSPERIMDAVAWDR
jgi:cytochrome P450